ncbi:unnamed protein product [Phaedon cochleariae]|uniref:Uncharacterized protein n=1 Tax=Phaedon cochleariae TaxID=80249 RepID=A0A9P0GX99_PHACE|nr:unnamed protein product [Phaedon cochleariae]
MVDSDRHMDGVYRLTRNENFREHLMAQGIDENKAQEVDQLRPLLKINIEGNDVTISTEMESGSTTSILKLDEEVEEMIALDMTIKSKSTMEDNRLKIHSEGPNGEVGIRIFEFSETGMIMTLYSDDPDVPEAKRFYERI